VEVANEACDVVGDHTPDGAAGVDGGEHGAVRGELRSGVEPADLATAVMTAVQGGLLLTDTTHSTRPLELGLDMALAHDRSCLRAAEPG
jgi:hypothetical protein